MNILNPIWFILWNFIHWKKFNLIWNSSIHAGDLAGRSTIGSIIPGERSQKWASAQYDESMRGNGWQMLNVLELQPIRKWLMTKYPYTYCNMCYWNMRYTTVVLLAINYNIAPASVYWCTMNGYMLLLCVIWQLWT